MEKKKKSTIDKILTSKGFLILVLLIGLGIFIYPLISDWYYRMDQEKTVREYEDMIDKLPTEEGKKILDQAIAYNQYLAGLSGGIYSEEFIGGIIDLIREGQIPEFFENGRLIGTVEIPKIDIKLPLRSGTDDDILAHSAGFLINTSLPVGGESTHSVITAHRGLPSARLFTDLDQLKEGDLFLVQVLDIPHAYEVDQIKIIEPDQTEDLGIVPGKDYMTLLTCHPYMINSHRLIVRGHRVPYTPEVETKVEEQKKENRWKLFWKQYKEYIIGIIVLILIVEGVHLRDLKRIRNQKEEKK
ncbi:MAG: class C sortase [Tissierellia bacterium]|nr:class C sortase [Tissierellia bacterium]